MCFHRGFRSSAISLWCEFTVSSEFLIALRWFYIYSCPFTLLQSSATMAVAPCTSYRDALLTPMCRYRLAILFTFFSNSFHGFCFMLMHCRLFSAEPKAKPVIINYKITSQWCAYNEHITLYSPLHFISEWARPNSFFFLHSLPFFNSLGWLQNHFPFIFHPIASLLAFVFLHEWNK